MKGRLLVVSSLFIVFLGISCKKEAQPGIIGNWGAEAMYIDNGNGVMEWVRPGMGYLISFTSNGRFSIFTDMPSGHGTFTYERASGKITLIYERSNPNAVATPVIIHVAEITTEKLTLVDFVGPNTKMKMSKY